LILVLFDHLAHAKFFITKKFFSRMPNFLKLKTNHEMGMDGNLKALKLYWVGGFILGLFCFSAE
jgi:hypothetical protein